MYRININFKNYTFFLASNLNHIDDTHTRHILIYTHVDMGSCLSSKNDGVALGRHPLASSSGGTWSSSNATTKTKKTTKDRATAKASSTTTAFQGTVSQHPTISLFWGRRDRKH